MPHTLPRKPKGSGIGHLIRFSRNPFEFLRDAYLECGDVFVLDMPIMGRYICIVSPELSRVVYSQGDDVFSAGLIHDRLAGGLLGKSSTLTADGEAHRYRQGLIIKYLNGPNVTKYMQMMNEVARQHIDNLMGGPISSCQDFAGRCSLEIIGRILFGLNIGRGKIEPLMEQFRVFTNEGVHSLWAQLPRFQKDLGPFSPWGRILRQEAKVRRNFLAEVQQLRDSEHGGPSICATLIQAGLTNDEIVDELFALLFAGHETTRNTLTWSVYQIMSHPGLRESLTAEVDAQLGDRTIDPSDFEHLPKLASLIHEVLRSSPIGPFLGGRIALRDFELGDYLIRAGDSVAFCGHTMGLREDVWPNASTFDPDRFLEKATQASPDHFPFGRGRRMCTGRGVALQESMVILATLLQVAEIELHTSKEKIETRGVMLGTPLGGLPFSLKPRKTPVAPRMSATATDVSSEQPEGLGLAGPKTETASCPFHHPTSN